MKKTLILGLLVVLLASCSSIPTTVVPTCGTDVTGIPHIFVVTAFSIERDAVMDTMQGTQTCIMSGITYHIGHLTQAPQEIILYMSGVGPEKATHSTVETLNNFEVEMLIFSGISGGIDADLSIGDTVVPAHWYSLSTGNSASVDDHLLEIASTLDGARYPDAGISADAFVSDEATVSQIRIDFGASVVDMETYYVADTATEYGIPFIGIRSVSDFANGEKNRDNYQVAAQASATYLVRFLGALSTP